MRGLESAIPPALAAVITLKLTGIQVLGSTVYQSAELSETYAGMIGKTVTLAQVILSRLRSGLSTHLGSLSFEGQGAFATQR